MAYRQVKFYRLYHHSRQLSYLINEDAGYIASKLSACQVCNWSICRGSEHIIAEIADKLRVKHEGETSNDDFFIEVRSSLL